MAIAIDSPVPDFSAPATGGDFNLTAHKGKQLVIYFYPKDNTPGGTTQGQGFRDAHEAFAAANTVIVGVSRDSLKTHENFKAKQGFPFELRSPCAFKAWTTSASVSWRDSSRTRSMVASV